MILIGTNYYVRTSPCPEACEHCAKAVDVHIGKSSVGWRFLHRAYRDPEYDGPEAVTWPVVDRASWLRLLDLGEIFDEYGDHQDRTEFLAFIDGKQDGINHTEYSRRNPHSIILDPGNFEADGHDFCHREFS